MDSTDSTASYDDFEAGVAHGRRRGAYAALSTARRTLRTAGGAALAQALQGLVSADDLGEVLRMLEDAADQAGERS